MLGETGDFKQKAMLDEDVKWWLSLWYLIFTHGYNRFSLSVSLLSFRFLLFCPLSSPLSPGINPELVLSKAESKNNSYTLNFSN